MEDLQPSARDPQVITWRSRAGRQLVERLARGGVGQGLRWRPRVSQTGAAADVHLK